MLKKKNNLLQKNTSKKGKRPFIADANSITGGQPIRKMLKNFR